MRTSTKLKITGGVLAASSLLVVIPAQANAAHIPDPVPYHPPVTQPVGGDNGGSGGGPCDDYYSVLGYTCGSTRSPAPNAVLIHVKLRGHAHTLDFDLYARNSNSYEDISVTRENSENVWFDPSQYSSATITLAGNTATQVSFTVANNNTNQNHCYFENKHGNLALATTGSACNTK